MEAMRFQQILAKDGELFVRGIPYKKGQHVEIIVYPQARKIATHPHLTVRQLRKSGLIGMWKEREDIKDSAAYAQRLREKAQKRGDINYDFIR